MEKMYFHIAAFELNKIASLKPSRVVVAEPLARFCTSEFQALWSNIFHHVWAQWRYENNLPNYKPPVFTTTASSAGIPPAVASTPGEVEVLSFCGGGKDSLVAMKLLERSMIPYSSFAYSHSIYGRPDVQHALIESLLQHTSPVRKHRQYLFDDFMDSPVLELHSAELGVKTLTAAETPSSIFAVLPVVLAHGYRYIVLAHERSADVGNLIWEATGEHVYLFLIATVTGYLLD